MDPVLFLANFKSQLSNFGCHITGVYAPNCKVERGLVWEEVADVRGLMDGPCAIYGDFNIVDFPLKKGRYLEKFSNESLRLH